MMPKMRKWKPGNLKLESGSLEMEPRQTGMWKTEDENPIGGPETLSEAQNRRDRRQGQESGYTKTQLPAG